MRRKDISAPFVVQVKQFVRKRKEFAIDGAENEVSEVFGKEVDWMQEEKTAYY